MDPLITSATVSCVAFVKWLGRLHQFLSVSQTILFPSGASGLQRDCPNAVGIAVNEVKVVHVESLFSFRMEHCVW